jgi:NAD(P)-dependent dehydrogenase (short-subunit alcohol dehydrogenase family)
MELPQVRALVTGAASGLGKSVCDALLAAGAKVAGLDKVRPAEAPGLFALEGDVAVPEDVSRALEALSAGPGEANVLVNCAGIGRVVPTLDWKGAGSLDAFSEVLRTNLLGTFNCIRLAAQVISRGAPSPSGERGVIVNTASIAAEDGQAGQAAYAASKAGICGMTLPIARDLAPAGIRVVTVAPGLFDTPMLANMSASVRAGLLAQQLCPPRFGRPEEFAALVLHAIQNPMLNGTTLRLDGGLRLPPR